MEKFEYEAPELIEMTEAIPTVKGASFDPGGDVIN